MDTEVVTPLRQTGSNFENKFDCFLQRRAYKGKVRQGRALLPYLSALFNPLPVHNHVPVHVYPLAHQHPQRVRKQQRQSVQSDDHQQCGPELACPLGAPDPVVDFPGARLRAR